jgi:hypothetical protein
MGLNLNLKNADLKGFDAIPAGTYDCTVYEATMGETEGGKLPKGTPFINVQFKVDGGEYDNRRVFRKFIIAPPKIDGKAYEHKAMMDGMLAKFFIAIGYTEDEVLGGSFEPDLEDFAGRECRVTVKQREYDGGMVNDVSVVRPRSEETAASSLL